jgi:hypothetical protein
MGGRSTNPYSISIVLGLLLHMTTHAERPLPAFPYLSHAPSKVPLNAYLLDELSQLSEGSEFHAMEEIMAAIHAQQHPDKQTCKSRRLLVTQFAVTNFEGIGSMLKQVMLGLAEAAYSNRTLIWGLDMPLMFEAMRDEWRFTHNSTALHKYGLQCDWKGGGGPYGCLFEPLSSCSITDLTWKELFKSDRMGMPTKDAFASRNLAVDPPLTSLRLDVFRKRDITAIGGREPSLHMCFG